MNMMQSEISQQPSSEVAPSNQGSWLALLTVAITAFALVTSEFLPIGVLNSISTDLHVSVGTAGLMITLPGIMAALAAPLLPVLVKNLDRRYLLLALAATMVIANAITAIAPNFEILLIFTILKFGLNFLISLSTSKFFSPAFILIEYTIEVLSFEIGKKAIGPLFVKI